MLTYPAQYCCLTSRGSRRYNGSRILVECLPRRSAGNEKTQAGIMDQDQPMSLMQALRHRGMGLWAKVGPVGSGSSGE